MTLNPYLKKLNTLGQSIWYDNLSRELLQNGEISTLVNSGVRGLTSNPTIFENAILSSELYDELIASASKTIDKVGLEEEEYLEKICEKIFINDVGSAADILKPVWEESAGTDGYASIEVSPRLAHDTNGTIESAKRIWNELNRPNIMIKVPATSEGIPAIKDLIYSGINVNVTLIFSIKVYEAVIEAYISALEDRDKEGKDIDKVASVASFFVSRVDVATKKACIELEELQLLEEINNKVALDNCKRAYALYLKMFSSERFENLSNNGTQKQRPQKQRPLWASTGTKTKDIPESYYVDNLVAHNTVNTVPDKTLKELMNSTGSNSEDISSLDSDNVALSPKDSISKLETSKINFSEVLINLEKDGVMKFAQSYDNVLKAVKSKVS